MSPEQAQQMIAANVANLNGLAEKEGRQERWEAATVGGYTMLVPAQGGVAPTQPGGGAGAAGVPAGAGVGASPPQAPAAPAPPVQQQPLAPPPAPEALPQQQLQPPTAPQQPGDVGDISKLIGPELVQRLSTPAGVSATELIAALNAKGIRDPNELNKIIGQMIQQFGVQQPGR
jgi:hypothetical protein